MFNEALVCEITHMVAVSKRIRNTVAGEPSLEFLLEGEDQEHTHSTEFADSDDETSNGNSPKNKNRKQRDPHRTENNNQSRRRTRSRIRQMFRNEITGNPTPSRSSSVPQRRRCDRARRTMASHIGYSIKRIFKNNDTISTPTPTPRRRKSTTAISTDISDRLSTCSQSSTSSKISSSKRRPSSAKRISMCGDIACNEFLDEEDHEDENSETEETPLVINIDRNSISKGDSSAHHDIAGLRRRFQIRKAEPCWDCTPIHGPIFQLICHRERTGEATSASSCDTGKQKRGYRPHDFGTYSIAAIYHANKQSYSSRAQRARNTWLLWKQLLLSYCSTMLSTTMLSTRYTPQCILREETLFRSSLLPTTMMDLMDRNIDACTSSIIDDSSLGLTQNTFMLFQRDYYCT